MAERILIVDRYRVSLYEYAETTRNLCGDENGDVVVTPKQGETGRRLLYPPVMEVDELGRTTYTFTLIPIGVETVVFDCLAGWYNTDQGFDNRQTDPRLAP